MKQVKWLERKRRIKTLSLQEKIEEVILEKYSMLYKMAFLYVKEEQDALDIVQESVYKAIKSSATIKEEKYIQTWLIRIVINTTIDFMNKRKKEVLTDSIPESGKNDTYDELNLHSVLEKLDGKGRAIIILRFCEQKKISEIAEILDEKESTVKTILYRTLQKLKIELGDYYE